MGLFEYIDAHPILTAIYLFMIILGIASLGPFVIVKCCCINQKTNNVG